MILAAVMSGSASTSPGGNLSVSAVFALVLVAAGVVAFVLGTIFTLAARSAALRIGFVDRPGGHKSHRAPIPYGGGSAMFASTAVCLGGALLLGNLVPQAWWLAHFGEQARAYVGGLQERTPQMLIILAGAAVLHVLGLIDDRRPLSPLPKLLTIVVVALAVAIFGDVRVAEMAGPAVAVTLTVLWFIIVVNAFNFLDNMDGLSGGVAAICLLFLAICGWMAGQVLVPGLCCVAGGAALGFLVLNFPPARIFMGDAGSLVLGYLLATTSSLTTYYQSGHGTPPYALAMPLVILAVPLYDFVTVVLIRLGEHRNPMRGDQRHFSHRLVDRGLSRRFAVLTIYLATATTGLAATLLPGADLRQTITIGVMVIMVLAIVAILESPAPRKPADPGNSSTP